MRLIDAEFVKKKMQEIMDYQDAYLPIHFEGILDDAPTVDAEPIIRCMDCKYWDYEVDNDVGFCVRTEDCDWNADDFCSKGEKR